MVSEQPKLVTKLILQILSSYLPILLCTIAHCFLLNRFRRGQCLQLTATRSTRYDLLTPPPSLLGSYNPRQCVSIGGVASAELAYGEFDTVGVVVCLTTANVPTSEG